MASVNGRELTSALTTKFGFTKAGGTRHDRYQLVIDNMVVAYVDVSRSQRELGPPLVSSMARQAGVNGPTLRNMVSCSVGRQDYLALIGSTER